MPERCDMSRFLKHSQRKRFKKDRCQTANERT